MLHPDMVHPRPGDTQTVDLKNAAKARGVLIGDYTIYNDPRDFLKNNVLQHLSGQRGPPCHR